MADEVKTRLTVEGDDAIRTLEEAARAEQQHADAIDKTGEAAERTTDKTIKQTDAQDAGNKVLDGALTKLGALGLAIAGANGLVSAYDQWIERIERASERLKENAEIARSNAEARLNFVALQGVETAEDLSRIDTFASFAGRSPSEVARVQGSLRSQFPNASAQDINNLTLEVAAAGQLTDAPLTELAQGLSVIYREVGDPRVAGNIFQESIQQAGEADPGALAQEVGKFIGIGRQIGGLDAGEAAGFAAAGTGLGLPNEVATTGLKNALFAIRGRGNPEGNELLDRLGIDRENVILALQQIAAASQAGQIDAAGLESIGGREAAPVFAALADPEKLQNFLASVGAVDAAEDYAGRIVTDKADSLFTPGSIQAFNLLAKRFEAEAESARAGDVGAARADTFRQGLVALLDREQAKPDGGDYEINADLAQRIQDEYDFQLGRGKTPEEALEVAERVPRAYATFPGISGPLRNADGEQVQFNGLTRAQTVTRERRRRNGFLSDPLGVIIERSEATQQAPLLDDAEEIRQRVRDEVIEEFGRDVREHGLTPEGWERLEGARDRALQESLEENRQSAAPRVINHGTMILNAGDPLFDDLNGEDRFA